MLCGLRTGKKLEKKKSGLMKTRSPVCHNVQTKIYLSQVSLRRKNFWAKLRVVFSKAALSILFGLLGAGNFRETRLILR